MKSAWLLGGAFFAGAMILAGEPTSDFARIEEARKKAPKPPSALIPVKRGWMYTGNKDAVHIQAVQALLEELATRAANSDKARLYSAFLALQGQEGSVAAINTWDNQVFTYGTGWSGMGALPKVLEEATKREPAIAAKLAQVGVYHKLSSGWKVADTKKRQWITGKEALKTIANSPGILYTWIDLARNQKTMRAMVEAQAETFARLIGKVLGPLDQVQTQAAVNFLAHLAHWAPGYMREVLPKAIGATAGPTGPERDKAVVATALKDFRMAGAEGQWRPSETQLELYWKRMEREGLDVGPFPKTESSVSVGFVWRSEEANKKFEEADKRWGELLKWGIETKESMQHARVFLDNWREVERRWKANPFDRMLQSDVDVNDLMGTIQDLDTVERWATEQGWKRGPRVAQIAPEDLTVGRQARKKVDEFISDAGDAMTNPLKTLDLTTPALVTAGVLGLVVLARRN